MGVFVGKPHPPPRRVVDSSLCFKGSVSYFPVYGFTLHLHTEIIHSICENHLLEQTYLLECVCVCVGVCVCCSVNHVIICHRHMPHCVWDTGLVARNPETHRSLAPRDVIQLSYCWGPLALLRELIFYRLLWFSLVHFHGTLCSNASFVLLWYHSWNSQTNASNNSGKI